MFWLLAPLALWLLYKWSVNNFDYFNKIGVSYKKPLPFIGNMLNVILQKEGLVDVTRELYEKHKSEKVFGSFNFKIPILWLADAELVKRVSIKDFENFMNHIPATTQADTTMRRSLFGLNDKEWKDMRSTLSPMFTSSKMKMMFGLLSEKARDFVNFYEERTKRGEKLVLDVEDTFSRFTADGISTTVLGIEADCVRNKDSAIFRIARNLVHDFFGPLGSLKLMFSLALPKVYDYLGLTLASAETHDFLNKVVVETMEERDRNNTSRPDVIQLMLQLKKGQSLSDTKADDVDDKDLANFSANIEYYTGSKEKSSTKFTDEDWISQGLIFFAAGFDTTSTMLRMTCYELALNPEVQQDLIEEVDSVVSTLDGKPIGYETLHKMKFLDMVISEGLRKWPPAVHQDRICVKDYSLDLGNGKTIPIKKGQYLMTSVYHIHRDPRYYPNPEKFDPCRFSDENKDQIVPGSYIPFGYGPRICIGSRFALMEGKLLLFSLLSKFSIEKVKETPEKVSLNSNMLNNVKETIYVKFVPRN